MSQQDARAAGEDNVSPPPNTSADGGSSASSRSSPRRSRSNAGGAWGRQNSSKTRLDALVSKLKLTEDALQTFDSAMQSQEAGVRQKFGRPFMLSNEEISPSASVNVGGVRYSANVNDDELFSLHADHRERQQRRFASQSRSASSEQVVLAVNADDSSRNSVHPRPTVNAVSMVPTHDDFDEHVDRDLREAAIAAMQMRTVRAPQSKFVAAALQSHDVIRSQSAAELPGARASADSGALLQSPTSLCETRTDCKPAARPVPRSVFPHALDKIAHCAERIRSPSSRVWKSKTSIGTPWQFTDLNPKHTDAASALLDKPLSLPEVADPLLEQASDSVGEANDSRYCSEANNSVFRPDDTFNSGGREYEQLPERTKLENRSQDDWHAKFREIMCMPSQNAAQRLERSVALRQLNLRFVRVASEVGKSIIRERHFPVHLKSIPPATLQTPGLAGGEKYVARGIFFKFALDRGIYGSDEFAAKAASHELIGAKAMLKTIFAGGIANLMIPLTVLIDWHGYRLIAAALMPINGSSTLCYGNPDAANTGSTQDSDPTAAALIQRAAAVLNLQGHWVGSNRSKRYLYGPADMEVHRLPSANPCECSSSASRNSAATLVSPPEFCVLDMARLFPPEAKMKTALRFPLDDELAIEERNYDVDNPEALRRELVKELGSNYQSVTTAVGRLYFDNDSEEVNIRATQALRTFPPLGESRQAMRQNSSDSLTSNFRRKHETMPCLHRNSSGASLGSNLGNADVLIRETFPHRVLDANPVMMVTGDAVLVRSTTSAFLHRLLRPELVASNPVPLSSDAFSRFAARDDPERLQHMHDVAAATRHLLKDTIPTFAKDLSRRNFTVVHHADLIQLMHGHGINVRYLGTIRAYCPAGFVRPFLLTEMCCRVLKNMLRAAMRNLAAPRLSEVAAASQHRVLAVDFFNLVLGNSAVSDQFWTTDLKVLLQIKFPSALAAGEREPQYDLRHELLLFPLFARLQAMTGVQFKTGAMKQLFEYPLFWEKEKPLAYGDLEEIVVLTKGMSRCRDLQREVDESIMEEERDAMELMKSIDDVEIQAGYNSVRLLRRHRRTEAIFGTDSAQVIASYFELASANNLLGNFTRGLEYALRGLSFGEVLFGAFSEQTLNGLVAVGDTLVRVGTREALLQAVDFFKRAIRSLERLYRLHPLMGKLACKLHFLLQEIDLDDSSHGRIQGDTQYLQKGFDAYSQMYGFEAACLIVPSLSMRRTSSGFGSAVEQATERDGLGTNAIELSQYFWPPTLLDSVASSSQYQGVIEMLKSRSAYEVLFHDRSPIDMLLALPPTELQELRQRRSSNSTKAVRKNHDDLASPHSFASLSQRHGSQRAQSQVPTEPPSRDNSARSIRSSVSSNNESSSRSGYWPRDSPLTTETRSNIVDLLPVALHWCKHLWSRHHCTVEAFISVVQYRIRSKDAAYGAFSDDGKLRESMALNPVFVEERVRLDERLRLLGIQALRNEFLEPDVDTQFAAISLLLFSTIDDAAVVRRCAAGWLAQNPSFMLGNQTLEQLIGSSDWPTYCDDLKKEKLPGDMLSLIACAEHYRVAIFVVSSAADSAGWLTGVSPSQSPQAGKTIFLALHNSFLWEPLELANSPESLGMSRTQRSRSLGPALDSSAHDHSPVARDPLTASRQNATYLSSSFTDSERPLPSNPLSAGARSSIGSFSPSIDMRLSNDRPTVPKFWG